MNFIEAIVSSPLSTGISVAIALVLLFLAYYLGLPMYDEVKRLRIENKQLKATADDKQQSEIASMLSQNIKFSADLQALTTELKNNPEKLMDRVVDAIRHLDEELDKNDGKNGVVFDEVRKSLQSIVEHSNSSKSRDEGLLNLMHEVIRHLHNISDKQSQIIGALLGMSRIQDRNRSL